ncbi:MAG: hypothetical protein ACFE9I_18650 [Candidatus Hermodarchaeota archaeon]
MNTGNVDKVHQTEIANIIIPHSMALKNKDIYSGDEKIPFKDRHPIFKSLMRLEFEGVMRDFLFNK